MHPIILVLIFIVATVVGYLLIKNVPSLLHTPLMSGMNALSGLRCLARWRLRGPQYPWGARRSAFLQSFWRCSTLRAALA